MPTTHIAIIKEEKNPTDNRVPLTPKQVRQIHQTYSDILIVVQESSLRCYSDAEYRAEGIEVMDDVSHCDILLGVKEVIIDQLIPGKTYLFFSHTIKKQPYNQELLQQIVKKNIRLIDYECLTDENDLRVIAFGRWAGIVGAYNALWTYGKKYGTYDLKRTYQCLNLKTLLEELVKVELPPVKILITGKGRVAQGSVEILEAAGIKKVDPEPYLFQQFPEAVYTQIDADVYTKRKDGQAFDFNHFYANPALYKSNFKTFSKTTDILIAAAYWDPNAPRLFEGEAVKDESFRIRIIADITCDIDGSIPTTRRPTTIIDPVYDFDVQKFVELPAFSAPDNLSVMSIDNLPNELPRDASESFGEQLMSYVLPELCGQKSSPIIENATIVKNGDLTEKYEYLRDYLDGK